jgi:hypothetical protein
VAKTLAGVAKDPGRRQARCYGLGEAAGTTPSPCGANRRGNMAKPDAVFIYIGTYPSEAAARED